MRRLFRLIQCFAPLAGEGLNCLISLMLAAAMSSGSAEWQVND